jgi:hypothetical protein
MTLKIKTDEDLPGSIAKLLRDAGYTAETVLEEELGGSKDPALWRAVQIVSGRYPGDLAFEEIGRPEAEEALGAVRRIHARVTALFKRSPSDAG